ncbi:MAG: hypothetical protein DWQ47_10160 [Acidobacteria bacterium]|nr:MAG: hypothetical protein DWQ32_12575 [Acidobacteriota bacterium]REJ97954.1 MAG: hypothetical protein DWQ38_15375 [Acidobacteriota bacterium]REK16697.1 MAG: hypothetical protein DWQ43_00420 [Acidobacteriota bacterium]REK42608.1 MAG: hypothetical protein DWQ47_10160 [Acidobacteriota bacterium]
MLRITETERNEQSVTYLIEGKVDPSGLTEIDNVCKQANGIELTPILDLSMLSFVERAAVDGFRALSKHRVLMINCSPFLAEQLKLGECNA